MLLNNKLLGKCWHGRHPWIRLAVECESMVDKGISYIFSLGTAYDISSMESIGNYSIVFVDRKGMPPKFFYLYLFRFELWHLYKSLLPFIGQKSSCGEPRTRKSVGYFIFPHKTSTSLTIPSGVMVSLLASLIVTSMSSI